MIYKSIKNKTSLKTLKIAILHAFLIATMFLVPFLMSNAQVSAAGKPDSNGNIVGSLCYLNGRVQLIADETQRNACTQGQGGTIIEPNQPVPVAICVYGTKIQQLDAGSQGCAAVGGTQVDAGQPLPAIVIPATEVTKQQTTGASGTVNTSQTVATNDTCGGEKSVNISINIGCKGKGNPILDMLFAIIRFLTLGVGFVLVGSMVVAGIQYTASRGDPQATAAAIKRITSTFFALLLFIFTYAILNWLVPAGILK